MTDTPRRKKQTGFRLGTDALALLRAIAERHGLTMTGALELVIREAAEKRGIERSAPDKQNGQPT